MTMAGILPIILKSSVILLASGCTKVLVRAACCSETGSSVSSGLCYLSSSLAPQKSWILDLNAVFFIHHILLDVSTNNSDSIGVDIGNNSCAAFEDKACYITCLSRDLVQQTACSLTINVTCNLNKNNVKGRYVRVRQNGSTAFDLCNVNVTGRPELKNYALHALCTESTSIGPNKTANKAVDGNRNGTMAGNSCSHTSVLLDNNTRVMHWWQVDMGKVILISHIIIANRIDKCCDARLANFTVELGYLDSNGSITYTRCHYYDGVAGPLTTLNCTQSMWGRFVRISKTGDTLTLCEVEVYGFADPSRAVEASEISEIKYTLNCYHLSLSEERIPPLEMPNMATVKEELKIPTDVVGETTGSKALTTAMTTPNVSKVFIETTPYSEVSTAFSTEVTQSRLSTVLLEVGKSAVSSLMEGSRILTDAGKTPGSAVLTTAVTAVSGSDTFLETTPYSKVSTGFPIETDESRLSTKVLSEATSQSGESIAYLLSSSVVDWPTRKTQGFCACRCIATTSQKGREDVQQEVTETAKGLQVQRATLTKQVRKKSSAPDQRLSSATLGIICIGAMSSIFVMIVAWDVFRLVHCSVKTKMKTTE